MVMESPQMSVLITGAAGFIGNALALRLLSVDKKVTGVDNLSDYYDVNLKKNRLARCFAYKNFKFETLDIVDRAALKKIFSEHSFDVVIHLAAQPGVRYSVKNPHACAQSNLMGFLNVLDEARLQSVKHFIYSSSSSVYGANTQLPFSERHSTDHPISLYGATKKANELMAHSHAHLYKLPCTGFRFFTVYGPWGRPDMALFKFARQILYDEPILVFNHGEMTRDFTYIDDVVEGIFRVIEVIPETTDGVPQTLYNIGNQHPVKLMQCINLLEHYLNKKARLEFHPIQEGDMQDTYADVSCYENKIGKLPHTPLEIGIKNFVKWYTQYYLAEISGLRA